MQDAIDCKRRKLTKQAVQILESICDEFPNQGPLYWYLGGIYQDDLNQPVKALVQYRRAVELNPKSPRASLGVFHVLWELKRKRAALLEMQRFQAIAHHADYDAIRAEIVAKEPALAAEVGWIVSQSK